MKLQLSWLLIPIITWLPGPHPTLQADPLAPPTAPDYYGKASSEVVFRFSHFIDTSLDQIPGRSQATLPSESDLRRRINRQLTYLYGSLGNHEPQGAPHEIPEVQLVESKIFGRTLRTYYTFEGRGILEKQNIPDGANESVTLYLPRDPDQIYRAGLRDVVRGQYPCTDREHPSEKYFWYFWDPFKYGCPLRTNQDYDPIAAQVERLANTPVSYPHYQELMRPEGLRIDLLMGMDDPSKEINPFRSLDLAAENYRAIHTELVRMGYRARIWSESDLRRISSNILGWNNKPDVFVESLRKQTTRGPVEIRFFFADTSSQSRVFHDFMKDAIENSDVFIYAGHSGLGEYLDLNAMELMQSFEIQFPRDRQQIYFFNGCSSYPYYNWDFFQRKGGTDTLDIVTNGLATYFSAIPSSTLAFIRALDIYAVSGVRTSYLDIINAGDSHNLLGVNGDEPEGAR